MNPEKPRGYEARHCLRLRCVLFVWALFFALGLVFQPSVHTAQIRRGMTEVTQMESARCARSNNERY